MTGCFSQRLAQRFEYYFIDKPLTQYRVHGTSSNKDSLGYLCDYLAIQKIFVASYKSHLSKEAKASWYAQIAALYGNLGREGMADLYFLKRFLADSSDDEAKGAFTARLEKRYNFLYKVARSLQSVFKKLKPRKAA